MLKNLGGVIGIAFVVLIAPRAGSAGACLSLAFRLLAVTASPASS